MWDGPSGPEGPSKDPPPNQELLDLKDQTEQQQTLIAQLKEVIRKQEQTTVNKEKMDEFANTLTRLSAMVKKNKDKGEVAIRNTQIDIPQRDTINLLKQQVEANKVILAERVKNQKGIEDMVTQIKAQFEDSQQIINPSVQPISFEKSIDNYSSQSSSEELYNLLVFKEKNITELSNKIQKLEASVLDLQENLKEKDSVIDARTKAITLMSENLSKKGKSTLDALDDTKEQMRKMQENFVTFETQMKIDKQKLFINLEEKNNELCIIQSLNEKLTKQVDDLKTKLESVVCTKEEDKLSMLEAKIKQNEIEKEEHLNNIDKLQVKINDLNATLKDLQSHVCAPKETSNDKDELAKLKKQLDESNKNMIKTKAQHKSKVKDLTKKIDAFKKISDVNAELVKLESDNSRLNLKIAELEEEKGNLQLKLNESPNVEDTKEEMEGLRTVLQEKDTIIATGESTIHDLNEHLDETRRKIIELEETIKTLTQLQNDQIKSEISSIDYEEKYDDIQKENANLLRDKIEFDNEKEKLLAEMETLKKDKQELNQKLDSYMQENMELIDKLEKLSAEKVSSAESIEIVENLTQQEKLEIEAYQKRLDITTGSIKNSSENLDGQDLNESVTQLNEETGELLQKIELFTVERREVMEKMDLLSQENSHLNVKIKEVEINRDMLAETYEHLQNEKELLDNKLEELDKQNKELLNNLEKWRKTDEFNKQDDLTDKLNNDLLNLQMQLHSLSSENELLKSELEIRNDDVYAITNYQLIIEENKKELVSSSGYINELQNEIERDKKEIAKYEETITCLNTQIENLNNTFDNQSNNERIDSLTQELMMLKNSLDETLKYTESYKEEINTNSATIETLNNELQLLNEKIDDMEELITVKDVELNKLNGDLREKNVEIAHLEEILHKKDANIQKVVNDFKEKYEKLQNKIETNSESLEDIKTPLQNKIVDLENKNKEKLEKMKIIAANLKKKSNLLQEFEEKYSNLNEKWENECKEKKELQNELSKAMEHGNKLKVTLTQLDELQEEFLEIQKKYDSLQNNYECKNAEYTKLEEEFNAYKVTSTNELEHITRNNVDLINKINGLEATVRQYEDHMNNYQQEVLLNSVDSNRIADLTQELNDLRYQSDTKTNALEMKIKELEMYIENQDTELNNYKEKVNKLVEGLGAVEKRRLSLENKAIQLGMKLEENMQQSVDLNFDDLERRFNALKSHDELIERQLQESNKEYNDLIERHHTIVDENENLKIQLNSLQEKYNYINSDFERLKLLEDDYNQQVDVIKNLEKQLKSTQNTSNEKLNELESYCEKIEVDFQQQQEDLYKEKKLLNEQHEKLIEELSSLKQTLDVQQKELIDKDEECQKLININISNESSLMQLNETILQYQNDRQQFEKELNQYKLNNEEYVVQKNAAEELINTLREENKKLQTKIEEIELKMKEVTGRTEEQVQDKPIPPQSNVDVAVDVFDTLTPIETFTWSDQEADDPFSFTFTQTAEDTMTKDNMAQLQTSTLQPEQVETNTESSTISSDDGIEALKKKIKTLEFMLFNVEKEKDDALLQCHELSNELTRLIYDKQNASSANLESQIVTAAETIFSEENRKELKKMEYEQCNIDPNMQKLPTEYGTATPVVEEVLQPKSTYLCYDEDAPDTKQIVKETESAKELFFDEEDGWGIATTDIPTTSSANSTLEEYRKSFDRLNETIRVLEIERENHLEEIKQCQIKSGKLIRKLKEFKVKNEELTKELKVKKSDNVFPDLDDAIQDELKNQISNLEKKLKEYENEVSKEKQEKENMNKRMDVLISANERMVVMKEKQDIEIISWQRQNRELQQKLEQMEWGNDDQSSKESPKKTPEAHEKIDELNAIIKDLSLDNEELQTLLEEQRRLRLEAEKNKSDVSVVHDMEEKLKTVLDENRILSEKVQQLNADSSQSCENLEKERAELQSKYNNIYQEYEDVKNKLNAFDEAMYSYNELKTANDVIKLTYDELKMQHDVLSKSYKDLEVAYADVKINYDQIKEELDENKQVNEEMQYNANEMMQKQYKEKCREFNDQTNKINILDEHLAAEIRKNQILTEEVTNLKQEIQQMQQNIDSNKDVLNDISVKENYIQQIITEMNHMENELTQLRESIDIKNNELRQLQEQLGKTDEEYNLKFSVTVEELNQQWAQRVDERGIDVAESWKLHLESRENEFSQVEQQIRKELNELEEKCNALVNENNELRKNVDAEIRNEVDRISALQQQINDRNQQISELQHLLQEKQQQIEQQSYLSQKLKEKDVIVTGIENSVTMLQEEVKKLHDIIKKQEEELLSKESALCIKQDELQSINIEFNNKLVENQKIRTECTNLQMKLEEIDHVTKELEDVNLDLNNSRQEIENLKEELANARKELDLIRAEISNKNVEINIKNNQLHGQQDELQSNRELIESLQNSLENRSDGTTNLQFELIEYKEKLNNLENSIINKEKCIDESKELIGQLQQQLVDYSTSYSTLEQQINEKDIYIMQINYRLQELEGSHQQNLANIHHLEQMNKQYELDIDNYKMQIQENETQKDVLNNETLVQQEQETTRLKLLLAEKEKEYIRNLEEQHNLASNAMENNQQQIELLKRQMFDYETKHEEEMSGTLAEIESLQLQLDDANSKLTNVLQQQEVYGNVAQNLQAKTIQCDDLTLKLNEQNILHEEESKQLIEVREIIEEQSKNIEELKAELYQKSTDYDTLISQISMSDGQGTTFKPKPIEEKPLTAADLAELDLALYMLHQRDVRCEELTVELMQLLEERDTLQLRLSNAIKEKEELRSKSENKTTPEKVEISNSTGAIPKSKAIILGATGTELATEATEDDDNKNTEVLANKLSELKTVGYKKDKNIVDEQEYRRLQQMSILQQHKDEVSKLPPEAAARLVDASYTLSRDVQSPSKVLLNWLWGRSTPKVNEL